MKTIIFFDIDNTVYNNTLATIPEQTKRLLLELSKKEDVILGLATGRSSTKLGIIEEILPYFTYLVLLNGSVVLKNNEVIFESPIETKDVIDMLSISEKNHFSVGMVGIDDEAVNYWDEHVSEGMKLLRGITLKVDPQFYLTHKIYQLWLFSNQEQAILSMADVLPNFRVYLWHHGGADFVYPHINKSFGIEKALQHEGDYRLICVGDGANDIQMIEMADIGIAMQNTRFNELKEKADHVAPHIMDDQLYDFFKSLGLV